MISAESIKNAINTAINADERGSIDRIKHNSNAVVAMANSLAPDCPDVAKIYRRIKPNKKEWGYIVNADEAGYLYTLMRRLNIPNLCDLGCGMGIILKAITDEFINYTGDKDKGLAVTGYDNEEALLKICKILNEKRYWANKFELKDITTLVTADIPDDSVIYWWLPMADDEMAEKFISNIVKVVKKGQLFAVVGHAELLVEYGCVNYGAMPNSTLEVLQKV